MGVGARPGRLSRGKGSDSVIKLFDTEAGMISTACYIDKYVNSVFNVPSVFTYKGIQV